MVEQSVRKAAFFEIARGELGKDIQADFEKAQSFAAKRGVPVKVKCEITVHPPEADDARYGSITYKHQIVEPPFASRKHETILDLDGRIVADAAYPPDQMSLELKPKMHTTESHTIDEDTGEILDEPEWCDE